MVSRVLLLQSAWVGHVELDPELQVNLAHPLYPHLFPHGFDRIQPACDVRSWARRQGQTSLGEHQSKVFTLNELQVLQKGIYYIKSYKYAITFFSNSILEGI